MQTTQQFCERNFPHNIGIEPSELNQVQMVRVFVTITQQLTLAQVTRKFCTQKGFSDHLAVKHENFTGTVCIFVNWGGGGGEKTPKFVFCVLGCGVGGGETTRQVFLWIHLVASNRFRIFRVSPSCPQNSCIALPV